MEERGKKVRKLSTACSYLLDTDGKVWSALVTVLVIISSMVYDGYCFLSSDYKFMLESVWDVYCLNLAIALLIFLCLTKGAD